MTVGKRRRTACHGALRPGAPLLWVALFSLTLITVELRASELELGEQWPGGDTTQSQTMGVNAFSLPSANMANAKQMDFKVGNGFFRRLWVSAPSSTKLADGLGPLYNARACQNCHLKDGRGHPVQGGEEAVSHFLRLSIPPQNVEQKHDIDSGRISVVPEPTYGGQLQNFAIPGHAAEGRMRVTYTEREIVLADGLRVSLRQPHYQVNDLGYGPLHPQTMISPRVAPPMIGLGLLEAIKDEDLFGQADPDDKNKDGISGRARMVWSLEHHRPMIGRFGWKGGNPTVAQQSADAFNGDIGISSPLFPKAHGDCTSKQLDCLKALTGNDPPDSGFEISQKVFDLVVFYSRNLAVPQRRSPEDQVVRDGKKIFHQIGCPQCHTPSYVTAIREDLPEQSGQKIWPYTDLLLHDMGPDLADNRPEGTASGLEWKTPPLWGIGLTQAVNGHTFFLHDGRARNLTEAIVWHGGEARGSKEKFMELSTRDRESLLSFVNSL